MVRVKAESFFFACGALQGLNFVESNILSQTVQL